METLYRRIGQGFCGTVWAAPTESGNAYAYKREDGGPGRSLYNDYVMHQKVLESLSSNGSGVKIPGCHQLVHNNDWTWWETEGPKFPKDFQIQCNILITDRIPPFPKRVRETLIDLYCPISLRTLIKSSKPDADCLIRPYLGRRRRLEKQSRFQAFSLRNYPLYLDQIEVLGLDSAIYAEAMAETLATLYWGAHIDANDIEFVLAPTDNFAEEHSGSLSTNKSNILGDHTLWILDFDCCKQISMDRVGVEQATRAFYRNDPFYPRPGSNNTTEKLLWNVFRGHFLKRSEEILGQGTIEAHLPALWVQLVEQGGLVEDISTKESASVHAV